MKPRPLIGELPDNSQFKQEFVLTQGVMPGLREIRGPALYSRSICQDHGQQLVVGL